MSEPSAPSWHDMAFTKLSRVLGPEKARAAMERTLEKRGIRMIQTVDDLYRFAKALEIEGGFAGTVGALLSLQAVMHGATDTSR